MKENLNIALIQSHLAWENPVHNRLMFSQKILGLDEKVDLVILPEMFTTGFTMNAAEVAETMSGVTVEWMAKMASLKNCAVTGSVIIEEKGKYYNRLIFMLPDGSFQYYDKHQLFTLAKEEEVFTAGNTQVIIEYQGWKIKPLICYDLRFPVWARNTEDYDVLLYVASWPHMRIQAWDSLLKARAIENMCYCIGVNRVGLDGKGFEYNGHSTVYNALGEQLVEEAPVETETILYNSLQKSHISQLRSKLGFLADRDSFTIT